MIVIKLIDRGPTTDVRISFFRDEKCVDNFTDVDLATTPTINLTFDGYYRMMVELHRMASRKASGADQALSEVINELTDERGH